MDKFKAERELNYEKEKNLKKEMHQLRVMDTQRNQERLKW